MHAATSKVENSAQGSSCKVKFVHAYILSFALATFGPAIVVLATFVPETVVLTSCALATFTLESFVLATFALATFTCTSYIY